MKERELIQRNVAAHPRRNLVSATEEKVMPVAINSVPVVFAEEAPQERSAVAPAGLAEAKRKGKRGGQPHQMPDN